MFKEPHEDLEQSFCAEIAIVVKHLKTVKETKGNKRIMQTAERVEKSENEESQIQRLEYLMFECGLTFTVASRKAERACVNMTSILVYWT